VVRLRQTRFQTYDYSRAVGTVDRFFARLDALSAGQPASPHPGLRPPAR
jgi:hypothetical protein